VKTLILNRNRVVSKLTGIGAKKKKKYRSGDTRRKVTLYRLKACGKSNHDRLKRAIYGTANQNKERSAPNYSGGGGRRKKQRREKNEYVTGK